MAIYKENKEQQIFNLKSRRPLKEFVNVKVSEQAN